MSGIAGSASADTDSVYSAWGSLEFVPFNLSPSEFTFWYKYTSLNALDSGIAQLVLYDTLANVVGTADFIFTGNSNVYQYGSSSITYTSLNPVSYYSLNFSTTFSLADYPNQATLGTRLLIDDVSFAGTNGITDLVTNMSVDMFPNPTDRIMTINTYSPKEFNLNIYAVDGKMIRSEKINSRTKTLSVEDLDPGIYVLKLISDDELRTKLFIKN